MSAEWQLSEEQRADTVVRIRETMATMSFFSGREEILAEFQYDLDAIAPLIEKKAYTVAKVEARTTTGMRPHHETLKVRLLQKGWYLYAFIFLYVFKDNRWNGVVGVFFSSARSSTTMYHAGICSQTECPGAGCRIW